MGFSGVIRFTGILSGVLGIIPLIWDPGLGVFTQTRRHLLCLTQSTVGVTPNLVFWEDDITLFQDYYYYYYSDLYLKITEIMCDFRLDL